jgi:hypothetical protein
MPSGMGTVRDRHTYDAKDEQPAVQLAALVP